MNIFFNSRICCLFLSILTIFNIMFFFHIKNSTHYLKLQVTKLENDILSEEHNLAIQQAEFNKKYNINILQELAKKKLKLRFSNVEQMADLGKILNK